MPAEITPRKLIETPAQNALLPDELKNAAPEALEQIARWLFITKISIDKIIRRCGARWTLAVSIETVRQFRKSRYCGWQCAKVEKKRQESDALLKELADNPASIYKKLIEQGGKIVFDVLMKKRGSARDLPLIKDLTRLFIAVRQDELATKKFDLTREKWEFDVSRRCFDHHKELQEIFGDDSLDEDTRLVTIRKRLFGGNLPA